MDFLKIDLDLLSQPAIARLKDNVTSITQVSFDKDGAKLTRFGTDQFSSIKTFELSTEEAQAFVDAWTEYQVRIVTHAEWQEAQKQGMIAEAKALAKSVQFDLDTLNIRAKRDNERWTIKVPAIGYEMYNIHFSELKGAVQDALDRIERDVTSAEKWHWTSAEWPEIIASYRRAFPLEPEAIQQARKLLEDANIENWKITPNGTDPGYYHFYVNDIAERENWPAAGLLEEIREYVSNSQEVTGQGEPDEILEARRLLTESELTDCIIIFSSQEQWLFRHGDHSIANYDPKYFLHDVEEYLADNGVHPGPALVE